MERNNGNDYTRETSDLAPNFILKEPDTDTPEAGPGQIRKAIDPLTESSAETAAPPEPVVNHEVTKVSSLDMDDQPKLELEDLFTPDEMKKAPEAAKATSLSSVLDMTEPAEPVEDEAPKPAAEMPAEPVGDNVPKPAEPAAEMPAEPVGDEAPKLAAEMPAEPVEDEAPKPAAEMPAESTLEDKAPADKEPALEGERGLTGAAGPQAKATEVMSSADVAFLKSLNEPRIESPEKPAAGASGSAAGASGSVANTSRPAASPSKPAATPAPRSEGSQSIGAQSRPRFENPSFDDGGKVGGYRDPRENFRYGESASWQSRHSRGPSLGKEKKSKPVTMSKKALAFLIAGCLLLSGLFGFGGVMLGSTLVAQPTQNTNQQATPTDTSSQTGSKTETAGYTLESATGSAMTVKEITASAKDSVVEIRTEGVSSDSWMQEYITEGAGSGVIISEDGYIMTNNHVISGARTIKVTTADGTEYDAELIGADDSNDVAIIKVDANGLKAATYGNSDELEVGDLAVAIGNPLGELGGTVTAGIISATDRALSIDGKTLHLLQTDSSINPGNSGGGLFNDDGQLIGLVVAKSSGSDVEGLGFAIPINKAADVAHQLMDKGYVSGQPSTGMTYQEGVSSGSSFDMIFGGGGGTTQVYIYSVNGNNARSAGFKAGDIVLKVDGEDITSFDTLSAIVSAHKVGDKLTFIVERDGKEKELQLTLEEKKVTENSGEDGNSDEAGGEEGAGGNEQPQQPGDDMEGGFSPFPEDQGGSLFDFFFR